MNKSTLQELNENLQEISDEIKHQLLTAIQNFNIWLNQVNVSQKIFDIKNIIIEPYKNEDWIMNVSEKNNDTVVSFNPYILKSCDYNFFEIVILHEFFHLVVQGVPNKDDATKIKDYFGSDFMSLIDIEADFYVALYLKTNKSFDMKSYWKTYFEGSKVFIDKWIRNKKIERFLGSVLTINKLFSSEDNTFDLYLPSISPIITEEHMKVLIIKEKHISFEEIRTSYEDFKEIKKLYKKPGHLTFEGYYSVIEDFSNKALKLNTITFSKN
jgi:hypothetical protein